MSSDATPPQAEPIPSNLTRPPGVPGYEILHVTDRFSMLRGDSRHVGRAVGVRKAQEVNGPIRVGQREVPAVRREDRPIAPYLLEPAVDQPAARQVPDPGHPVVTVRRRDVPAVPG